MLRSVGNRALRIERAERHDRTAYLSPQEKFDAYLGQGRFMIQQARGSGAHIFYPRVAEPASSLL